MMHHGVHGLADQLILAIAEHRAGARVDEGDHTIPVNAVNPFGRRHQDLRQALIGLVRGLCPTSCDRAVGAEQDGQQDEGQRHGNRENAQHGSGIAGSRHRLAKFDLGNNANIAGGVPIPRTHDQHAAHVAVPLQVMTLAVGNDAARGLGQRPVCIGPRGDAAHRHIDARIPNLHMQDGGMPLDQEICRDQLPTIPRFGQQPAVAIDGIGLTRHTGPAHAEGRGIFRERVDAQGQITGHLIRITDRGNRIHQDFLVDRLETARVGQIDKIDDMGACQHHAGRGQAFRVDQVENERGATQLVIAHRAQRSAVRRQQYKASIAVFGQPGSQRFAQPLLIGRGGQGRPHRHVHQSFQGRLEAIILGPDPRVILTRLRPEFEPLPGVAPNGFQCAQIGFTGRGHQPPLAGHDRKCDDKNANHRDQSRHYLAQPSVSVSR